MSGAEPQPYNFKLMKLNIKILLTIFVLTVFLASSFLPAPLETIKVEKGSHISLIGGNLGSRMMNYGHFETEMHVRYPDNSLVIRNMCDGADRAACCGVARQRAEWGYLDIHISKLQMIRL